MTTASRSVWMAGAAGGTTSFVERLWRSIKYEEVYLHAYETVRAAQEGVERYLMFYNQARPHPALDGKTPDQVYCDNLPARRTAA
jgi:putative transposase